MKATGIVRRIDDLGRVVVPKEIRRTLRIREGDPLEIFTDREGEIILKKYSPIGELSHLAEEYAQALSSASGCLVCITDKDHVVAVAGSGKREFDSKPISKQLDAAIEGRQSGISHKAAEGLISITTDDKADYAHQAISTIISAGDAIGAVVLCRREEKDAISETELKLAVVAAGFLGKQMEG
ncbi:AbrB family transcriptional regulator [Clostridia bacterium]|nr:AbrB family transcriptional regulator [Clostridia bacterium]